MLEVLVPTRLYIVVIHTIEGADKSTHTNIIIIMVMSISLSHSWAESTSFDNLKDKRTFTRTLVLKI